MIKSPYSGLPPDSLHYIKASLPLTDLTFLHTLFPNARGLHAAILATLFSHFITQLRHVHERSIATSSPLEPAWYTDHPNWNLLERTCAACFHDLTPDELDTLVSPDPDTTSLASTLSLLGHAIGGVDGPASGGDGPTNLNSVRSPLLRLAQLFPGTQGVDDEGE